MKQILKAFLTGVMVLMSLNAVAQEFITVSGTVIDRESGAPLSGANIVLRGTGIGTVTNAEGLFSLVFPSDSPSNKIEISHLGYANETLSLPVKRAEVKMRKINSELRAAVIYGGDARNLVEEALSKISDNYSVTQDMLSAFYRETLQKGRRYIQISEAFMDVSKGPYTMRHPGRDRVQVKKGRSLVSGRNRDTLSVKVAGGPNLAVLQDFVKNENFFLHREELESYDFMVLRTVYFNDRNQFEVHFQPNVILEYPLFSGVLYIDVENLTITRAEIELDMSDKEKVSKVILQRKPFGLRFNPQKVAFTIAYRQDGGRSFLSYVRNEMSFRCDWRKRLFYATYSAVSEMVSVDRNVNSDFIVNKQDAFRAKDAFSDMVLQYWDEDFWAGYNIIEPTESLERAVGRLRRSVK